MVRDQVFEQLQHMIPSARGNMKRTIVCVGSRFGRATTLLGGVLEF